MWGSHFCLAFVFIPHGPDGFAGTHYRVLASSQSWRLRLCGYQCSTCMHPCLHAIGMCPYPFLCQDCGTDRFPVSCWSPSGSIIACGFSCMTFSWFHRRSFMPEFQCLCEIYGFAFIPRLMSWAFCLNDRKAGLHTQENWQQTPWRSRKAHG